MSTRTAERRRTAEQMRSAPAPQPTKRAADTSSSLSLDMCGCMSFWARLLIWATRNNEREHKIRHGSRLSRMMHRDRVERHHV